MNLISCLILAFGALSCSQHVYYYPTAPSVPLLTEKGDAMVSYAVVILVIKNHKSHGTAASFLALTH